MLPKHGRAPRSSVRATFKALTHRSPRTHADAACLCPVPPHSGRRGTKISGQNLSQKRKAPLCLEQSELPPAGPGRACPLSAQASPWRGRGRGNSSSQPKALHWVAPSCWLLAHSVSSLHEVWRAYFLKNLTGRRYRVLIQPRAAAS